MKFHRQLKQRLQCKTRKLAGGKAYGESQKLELVSILLTSFLDDRSYRTDDATVKRLRGLVAQIADREFVAKAAFYARTDAGMRSVSHLVASDLANQVNGAETALENVPKLKGRILVAMDCSGSMIGRPMKIGSLFASTLYKANDADLMLFSGDARYVTLDKSDSTLTLASRIEDKAEWSRTNFHSVFQRAQGAYDRVVILSDMQAWMGHCTPEKEFAKFVKHSGRRPRVYSFDLAGDGTLQFPERDVFCLAGFSDRTIETMKFLEDDKQALLRQIEAIEL